MVNIFYPPGEQAFDDIVWFCLTGSQADAVTMFTHHTRSKGKVYTQK